ncbi:MAG: ABC transporter substrate-binding protein, partial [bacterium]
MAKKLKLNFLLILTVSFCLLLSFGNIMADDTSEVYNLENYNEEFTDKKINSFKEAPELEEKVESGDLPPVEERLPENPLVITPWKDIGEYGGTWKRLGTSEEMDHFRTAISGFHLSRYINDGLDIVPNLLTHWESNEDKSEWTLHFRKGVKWSDGEPFTVDDVLFWYEDMAKNPECSTSVWDWNRAGGELVEMEKIDDYTLKLNYAVPSPLVIGRMAISPRTGAFGHMVLPKHYLKQYHPDYNDEYDNFETLEEKQEWWQNEDMPVLGEWKPVEIDPGERFVLERNPYYFAVDPEGNQLPYIDKVEIEIIFDNEMFKLKASQGESDMQIRPGILEIPDVSMLKNNEDEYNFETLTWNSASGTGSVYYPNQNHPDPEKKELYQNSKFLKALSHGINREQINKMVYYDTATETTGTFSPQVIEYQSEKGQEIYKEWRDSAKAYDPEKSKALLDELDVIDQNGDGWRQLPNGDDLELRIDMDAEAGEEYTDTTSIVKENWEDIGLKV